MFPVILFLLAAVYVYNLRKRNHKITTFVHSSSSNCTSNDERKQLEVILKHIIPIMTGHLIDRGVNNGANGARIIKTARPVFSKSERVELLRRDPVCRGGCGVNFGMLKEQIDHIVPHSVGGKNAAVNYQLLCSNCHSIKCRYEHFSGAYKLK